MYEGVLEDIKNGLKVSKSVDGNDDIMLAQGPLDETISTADERGDWGNVSKDELLKRYGGFGMSFNSDDEMLYNGELVRYFCDGCEVDNGGWATRYAHFNKDGVVDVYTVYEAVPNGDGSVDQFGKLVGLRKASKEEFDLLNFGYAANLGEISQGTVVISSYDEIDKNSEAVTFGESYAVSEGRTFESIFAGYGKFGITYKATPNGLGNVYYNGELVKHFSDVSPNGSSFSFESTDGGEITVSVVYDEKGYINGVKKVY